MPNTTPPSATPRQCGCVVFVLPQGSTALSSYWVHANCFCRRVSSSGLDLSVVLGNDARNKQNIPPTDLQAYRLRNSLGIARTPLECPIAHPHHTRNVIRLYDQLSFAADSHLPVHYGIRTVAIRERVWAGNQKCVCSLRNSDCGCTKESAGREFKTSHRVDRRRNQHHKLCTLEGARRSLPCRSFGCCAL